MDLSDKEVIHISHIDSDGYASQYLINCIFDNIEYFNINYNDSIIDTIFISRYIKNKPVLILSDISMSNYTMDLLISKIEDVVEHVFYIDHHQDEVNMLNDKVTIIYDKQFSSTELIYKYFIEDNKKIPHEKREKLKILAKLISVYDLNKIHDEDFCKSTVINDSCMAEWCNPFSYKDKRNSAYRFMEIEESIESLVSEENFINLTEKLDDKRTIYLKENIINKNKIYDVYDGLALANPIYLNPVNHMFFVESIKANETFLKATNNVKQEYLLNILNNVDMKSPHRRKQFLELYKKEFEENINPLRVLQKKNLSEIRHEKGVVVLNKEKQMLFHSIAPDILKNREIKVLCNILDENRISVRTCYDVEANVLARDIFGGGGHKYEAGGEYTGNIVDVKKQVQTYISEEFSNEKHNYK
jgi:hypothetical protein